MENNFNEDNKIDENKIDENNINGENIFSENNIFNEEAKAQNADEILEKAQELAKAKQDEIKSWISSILWTVVITLILLNFVFALTRVEGISMEPTLHTGDRVFEWKLFKYFREPNRGDIVVVKGEKTNNENYIKRLIGFPGDVIDIIDGDVYVNGKILNEPYLDRKTSEQNGNHWVVPEGCYFVMGDNRENGNSYDSRSFGPIEKSYLQGKALFRFWPLNQLKIFR